MHSMQDFDTVPGQGAECPVLQVTWFSPSNSLDAIQPTPLGRDRSATEHGEPVAVSTGRLEAFSDGVIAVAITLLVLNLQVPEVNPHARPGGCRTLACALASQWPSYAAYVTSFLTIGIIWVNHHVMISRLREADRTILFLNLLLLLSIGVLPFATNLMATYLKRTQGQHLAAAVYSGAFLLMAVCFATLNRHILLVKPHRLRRELALDRRRQILARSIGGAIPYVIATALAAVSPYVTLVICAAIAVFYALPVGSGGVETA
jgi:uncharacterized membrane protein